METFAEVQLKRWKKAAGGFESRRKLERGLRRTSRVYSLRGRVRCGYCQRRMEGTPRGERIYYRCAARSIVPGSPILDTHPKNVYLPEAAVLKAINGRIGSVFDPGQRDETVQRMLGAAAGQPDNAQAAAAQRALAEAETTLRRLQAGADPALADPLNRAQERVMAARLERDRAPSPRGLGRAEVEAMLDYLGDVGAALKRATPERQVELYTALSLNLTYHPVDRLVDVAIEPRRGSERVRGGNRPPKRSTPAQCRCPYG